MFQSAYWQQNCKGHCDCMLGLLSSLVELVKVRIAHKITWDLHKFSIVVCVEFVKVW